MLDLVALRVYCDLVETGSFTQAAERNFLSQSAVSQRIRALEASYGQVFLERGKGKGRVTPTDAGELLYRGARPLIQDAEELDARLRGLTDELSGTVRVATVYSVGLHALPGRLKPFLAAHPAINVHLEYSQTEKVYQAVLSAAVDVGIVACPSLRAGIDIVPFGTEEMVAVCAAENRLASRPDIRLRDLDGVDFVAFESGIPTRRLIDERFLAARVQPRITMTFDNIETIKNVVEIGSGVSILPESSVRRDVREGNLAAIPFAREEVFTRDVGLILKTSRSRRAAVRAFVEAVAAPAGK
jgi:DNA-binding transcriptional LysR family regulator